MTVSIRSQGTVKARQEIDLVSEVSGRVITVAAEFVAGGQVAAGTVLLQIDPIDYEVAIAEAQAALAAAQLRLAEVKVVLMRAAIDEAEPAEAAVKAAKSRLRQAGADLDNTTITAPFDAIIEGIDIADAIRIPRSTLHSGNFVYLVEDGLLSRRKVEVLRREQDSLIIQAGLERGDVLVLSRLHLMVEGTAVAPAGNCEG